MSTQNECLGFGLKTSQILNTIKSKAMLLWGDRWETELTRKYNELYNPEGDTNNAYRNKRSQIARIFQTETATLITAEKLATCVNLELIVR